MNPLAIESIGDVVAYITGSSVSAADATNSAQQAVAEQATSKKVIATAGAANDLLGVVAGGMEQTLQQFSPTSEEAAKLLGKAGATTSVFGLSLAALPIVNKVLGGEGGKITSGELDALSGAALLAGAVMLPEVAVTLTVIGSLMVAASIFDTNPNNTLSNAITQIKNLIQPYYSQLAPSDQAAFTSAMSDAMQSTLSGGMLVPQVNDAGWITGYTAEKPTSVNSDGNGTQYTFASGVTYIAGTVTDDDPLTNSSSGATKDVWTIPETGKNSPLTLDIHQDGSYSNSFTDSDGNRVTEIYITGSSTTYSVAAMTGDYQFIYVGGTDDQVTIHGDNNLVSLADGNHAIFDGANNIVHAGAGTTVQFGSADGNTIYNDVTGETLTVSGGSINVTGALNGGCGGEEVTLGTSNHIAINTDGSKTLTLRYDGNDRVYHRTYNAAGVQTEVLVISPDGSYADNLYDPVTGLQTRMTTAASDGTGLVMKFNAAQQLIEQDYIRSGGVGTQFIKDPATGQTTAINSLSGALLDALHYDPATDAVTWTSRTFASVRSTAPAYAEADHQAVQLVQAMAAYAPEPSASTSLTAVPPENSQLLLAASTH
ncbi:hypothetical protein PQQ52_13705 [Paraburkholderia sediminicola]|uniref:hypothetical protein n=1 Tax=Paraburkholderia sediminicola TaxID=458836 RepID=UPI0038BB6B95